MDEILKIKNLNLGFIIEQNYYSALNDVNLSFEKAKIHAIAGESGCGKSVLINAILNLLDKNAKIIDGEIIFENQNLLNLNETQMRKIRGNEICLIPQDPFMSLNPLYTIENQMMEIPYLVENYKKNEVLDIIKNSLDEVRIKNIDTVLKSYPHELSGGMKQRVIIAMALVSNSKLILADEPTTALDVSVSNSILDLLVELKNKGKTIILITHDLSIVSNYCDTTTIMYLGCIMEQSSNTIKIFKNPLHPYTIALLGALPNKKGVKLENIKGQISPITQIIEGCKFHPRCNCVMEKCRFVRPELKDCNGTQVACWLHET